MNDENKNSPNDLLDENLNDQKNETGSNDLDNSSQPKGEFKQEHRVIHKKNDKLHIYVRQDKYKGELKSKNWVGRTFINGKQKVSSSGTTNLDEAIPILENWYDDLHANEDDNKKNTKKHEEISKNVEPIQENNNKIAKKKKKKKT